MRINTEKRERNWEGAVLLKNSSIEEEEEDRLVLLKITRDLILLKDIWVMFIIS